ncbi:Scarecrow-like protein 9 [Dichanthelium oligosanthes]|uniref:Scarecrow-like protein 9 n=1 Tax=Dichanthelium oligosanthes TaxID=888268 RepID=A0A1E5VVB5_9POAL|nr:Scarecrow-like protein 9 [Dichanthelium oligosanthes]
MKGALQAAEKGFYEILGQVYPASWTPLCSSNEAYGPDESRNNCQKRPRRTSFTSDISSHSMLHPLPAPSSPYNYGRSLFLPYQPLTSIGRAARFGFPALQIIRGAEDAKGYDKLVIYLDSGKLSICRLTTKAKVVKESKYRVFEITDHRNNPYIQDLDTREGRSSKQHTNTITCEIRQNRKFDRILLCYRLDCFDETRSLQELMAKQASMTSPKGQSKGPAQQKLRGKRQINKEVVDLRTLLIHCAPAVAADDRLLVTELIKKIRQHSSVDGDCTQRLAFYLADGLEARLAGIGSQVYHRLMAKRVSVEDVFKIYNLCLAAFPLHRASYTFANRTIIEASKGQSKVHIIDFGICSGFQWPSLIQKFAEQGVPPNLRITGIDVPQPGFGPLEINEQAGKRLADYANMFKNEVLIVNCMYRMRRLGDETVDMNSARDRVLKIIRRMNTKVFILGIVNGSYSSPFFITRFKELLFHYSSLFDMFDVNVPRDNEARKLLEGRLLGREALNVIACEGAERTDRPETYKQWQVRCLKAGFEQLPVDPDVLNSILEMKKGIYHEDFVADEDTGWLLQGWKGRVMHAISKWKPKESCADHPEYCEINSNTTLEYINRILMEEDVDENASIYQERDALQATEKPFYDILEQAYPSSAKETVMNSDSQVDYPDDSINNYHEGACSGSLVNDFLGPQGMHLTANGCASQNDHLSLQFTKGAEEANKFVPIIEKLAVDLDSSELAVSKQMTEAIVGQKGKHVNKIRSHPHVNLELLDARNSKHLAISGSETIRDETFDSVLLCTGQLYRDAAHLRGMKEKEVRDSSQNAQNKGYGQGQVKSRAKKQQEEVTDFRALLIQCAEAIASNNQPFDRELLTRTRNRSSPYGDGSQRLAIYFIDALEARLAGTGSQMYQKLIAKRTSTTDMLKAYRLFTAACPFTKVAYYYSNQTIVDVLEGRPRVHIIDFGITFGFQWPSLIQRFANREGGPPNLRITGIDVAETGFRPCKRIEETGKRLAEYAEMFNVPFQYQGLASRWENICIEDLNIDKDEVLIINCLYQMKNLGDATEDIDSARDRVLRLMKRINPGVLIIGVENGSNSSPFFLPRFREALFYYSSLFDMLNSTVARSHGHEARILIERDLLGADVVNVVACEGAERIERPANYKQWQINSNMTLNYINRLLMEEDSDEKDSIYQRHDALQATEKPFYDILGQAYPSSPKETMINIDNQVDCPQDSCNNYTERACSGSFVSAILGPQVMHLVANDWASECDHLSSQFERGAEEANKLVPSIEKLVVDLDSNGLSDSNQMIGAAIGQKSKHVSKIRSHPHVDLELLQARNSKHLAILASETIRDEMFDSVLLCDWQLQCDAAQLREMKAKEASNCSQNVQSKGNGQGQVRSRCKKKEEGIDLRAVLIQCARAIAENNLPFASELLKKIRHHASPYGDGSQRLALYFANGLEARLAGTGSQIYQKLMEKRTRATDMLKAYRLFIAACPFARVAYYFSNQTIADVLEGRPKVHIIDFGITLGFQWPSLIQRFAMREGGPPKLRITGIDVPQSGFHPCALIESTGKRLAEYAEMFNVPFQYQGIASRWENICINNLNIDNDEVLIINCMYRMKYLGDETEDIDCPRDRVLRIMKRINPEVLILGIVNGLYSSPFFLPRFREVLFHYSSLFDMLNTTVLQNHEERIQIERDLLGAGALNVVACEGAERVERPETYKQWQVRSLKAGFKQLPVNQTILKRSIDEKNKHYHDEFVINEDSGWLLQGWKGRIMHAVSSWKPKESCSNH